MEILTTPEGVVAAGAVVAGAMYLFARLRGGNAFSLGEPLSDRNRKAAAKNIEKAASVAKKNGSPNRVTL